MLNRRLTGGLAWAGLILILAVPSAEILTGKSGTEANAVTDPIQTASISETRDAVDKLLSAGEPMPDYISDGDVATAPRQVPATGTVAPIAKPKPASVQTASLPTKPVTAPKPMPASMRPLVPAAVEAQPAVETVQPLVLDEQEVLSREAAVAPQPLVLEPEPSFAEPDFVTEDQLEEWDSGSLADYLERRGLLSDGSDGQSTATFADDDDVVYSDGTIERRRNRRGVPDDSFIIFPAD